MKKLLAIIMVTGVCLSLVGCGGSKDGQSAAPDYTVQKVVYDDAFEIECINDEVICDKQSSSKSDNLVITVNVKNIGKKDSKITSVANIMARQDMMTLYSSSLKDKKGNFYSFYRDQIIKPGKTKTFKYAWKLEDSKEKVIVDFRGYTTATKGGKMAFKVDGRQSKENAKYVAESKKEYESKTKIKEAKLTNCDVVVPEGWFARSVSDTRLEMQKKADGPTQIVAITSYNFKLPKGPEAEAKKYVKNFNNSKLKVKKYKVAGKTFYGFEPVDTQFYIYGQASNGGRIEVSGMQISWKDAKKVVEKMIKKIR